MTKTELKLISAAAIIGENNIPKKGTRTFAIISLLKTLYTKAKNRSCFYILHYLGAQVSCFDDPM
jgi:hypothetical protein